MTLSGRVRRLEGRAGLSQGDRMGGPILTVMVYDTDEELRRAEDKPEERGYVANLRATRAGLDELLRETEARYQPQRVIFLICDTAKIDAPYPPEVTLHA